MGDISNEKVEQNARDGAILMDAWRGGKNAPSILDSEGNPVRDDSYNMVKDLCAGDERVARIDDFLSLNNSDIVSALRKIVSDPTLSKRDKMFMLDNSWRIIYRRKPPTMEEFLSEEWIGATANSLYPHVHKILGEFYAPDSEYRHLILSAGIGIGKSTISVLSSFYNCVNLWCMRSPKKYFGLAESSSLVFGLVSFTQTKASQLLLQPFKRILLSANKFRRVKMEEQLDRFQKDNPDMVCWTTSSQMGAMQFFGDIHYVIMSDPAGLLGLNIVQAIFSEISFFIDKGFGPDYIWKIYQDAKGRVTSRFFDKRFTGTIIDSSPNDINASPIDKYIFSGEARAEKRNYLVTGAQWEFLPAEKYPIWGADHSRTFPVFRGSDERPAKVLEKDELGSYPKDEIYDVPIDLWNSFQENTLKSVKDFCGYPSGLAGMLMKDDKVIEAMFVPRLKNVYTYIYAPASKDPKHLIWNIIKDQFFVRYDQGYELWRDPQEMRYLHVDQSESGDVASIAMVHPEMDVSIGEIVCVGDFVIPMSPEKERINLDAIRYFIYDLWKLGHVNVGKVTFDQYQSSSTLQFLTRMGMNCSRLSVDNDVAPYYSLISQINTGKVKIGKNILLKNNLKSLRETRTPKSNHLKIDHTDGKTIYQDGGNWEKSQMGKFAKDVSDSLCGAVWNTIHEFPGVPRMQYDSKHMDSASDEVALKKERMIELLKSKFSVDVSGI